MIWVTDGVPLIVATLLMLMAVLRARQRSEPHTFQQRRVWAVYVTRTPGQEILAVQTVRNSLMAASLMATTAALGVMGVLTFGRESGALMNALPSWFIGVTSGWQPAKLVALSGALAITFMLFSLAVRLYHRVGYTLVAARGADDNATDIAANELMQAARFYRTGWRGFYLALVIGAWLFGSWSLFAALALALWFDSLVADA